MIFSLQNFLDLKQVLSRSDCYFHQPFAQWMGYLSDCLMVLTCAAVPVALGFRRCWKTRIPSLLTALEKQVRMTEQRAAELSRSNEELEQFAYIASHDLQEPLRAIASHLGLLSKKYGKHLDEKADRHINHAVEGAVRMQALINDLLAFSRIRGDERSKSLTDLNAIVKSVLQDQADAIGSTQANITVEPLPAVVCFPEMMMQLFQNIISNAIKFKSQACPVIHISAARREKEHVFCVEDNGIGIDPKHGERIFLIFQRLHTREEYAGTGLGLAICKKVVTCHGGRIWVESNLGSGSKFFFSLPMSGGNHGLAGGQY